MVSERMKGLGTARSVIRELFEYGNTRAAQIGRENVFDFSIGNPSVPSPDAVNETAVRLLREQPDLIHAYTSAQGPPTPGSALPTPSTAASAPIIPPTGSTSRWGPPPPCAACSTG